MAKASLTIHLNRLTYRFVELDAFDESLHYTSKLLKSVCSNLGLESVKWVITDLQIGSGLATVTPQSDIDAADSIIGTTINGINTLNTTGEPPEVFDDATLKHIMKLAHRVARSPSEYELTLRNGFHEAKVTLDTYQHVQRWLNTTLPFEDIGSIEGKLEMITIRRQPHFRVYHEALDGKEAPVDCRFDRDSLDEVKRAIGERVIVTGSIKHNRHGRITSIKVDQIEVLPDESDLKPFAYYDRVKFDISGGVGSEVYVRSLRDE